MNDRSKLKLGLTFKCQQILEYFDVHNVSLDTEKIEYTNED